MTAYARTAGHCRRSHICLNSSWNMPLLDVLYPGKTDKYSFYLTQWSGGSCRQEVLHTFLFFRSSLAGPAGMLEAGLSEAGTWASASLAAELSSLFFLNCLFLPDISEVVASWSQVSGMQIIFNPKDTAKAISKSWRKWTDSFTLSWNNAHY